MSANNSSVCCVFESPLLVKVLPPILIIEFIFGLTGNILALGMFALEVGTWKPNSIYLAHLAVADLLLLFCMPFRAIYYIRGQNWIFGDTFCRILLFILAGNRAAGVFFLTAVAVDRYLKIAHPLHRINRMNLSYAMWVSLGLWVMVIVFTGQLLGAPHFLTLGNHTQCDIFSICFDKNPLSIWNNAFYVIQFCVPAGIIIFCTACITWQLKTKTMDTTGKVKRAVHLIFAVAMVFFTCFLPSTVSRVAVFLLKLWYSECSHFYEANVAFYLSLSFTYLHSVLNPIVYYFASPASSGTMQKIYRRLTGQKEEVVSGGKSMATVTSG